MMRKIGKINIVAVLIIAFCIITIIKIKMPEQEIRTFTSEGIIATVESVEADKNECIIEVNLRKEDNTTFTAGDRIGIDRISSPKGNLSWHKDIKLSQDERVLTYRFTVFPGKDSELKRLKIDIDSLVHIVEGEKTLEKSIYDLYEEYPLEYDYEEELPMITYEEEGDGPKQEIQIQDKVKGYVPLEEIDNFSIIGVGFSDHYDRGTNEIKKKLLHIRTRLTGPYTRLNDTARIDYLYNELTGEKVEWIQGMTIPEANVEGKIEESNGFAEINEDYYELTQTEKLKSIRPIVSYTKLEVINSGKWTLRVNVKDNVKSLSEKVDVEISIREVPVKLNRIYISAIGADIQGTVLDEDKLIKVRGVDVPLILYMKDGSEIKLQSTSWSDDVAYVQEYEADGYIDVDEIAKVKIENQIIEIK